MKRLDDVGLFLRRIHIFPIYWLKLPLSKRLFIVALSYVMGIVGLWFLFPLVHNGASMFLPVISACWLFRYRGMIVSLVLNGIAFQLTYNLLLRGMLPDQAFIEGGILGFGTSLGLGLVVCWLRTAVDLVHMARQQALTAEQERLLAVQAERQTALAYEQLRKINELKDRFLLNVSHELRTPLTVLGGSLELLEMLHEQLEPQERVKVLQEALKSHEELVDLVNRMLEATVAGDETPQTQPELVYIHQFLLNMLAHLPREDAQALQGYTIHLQVPEQITVWADPGFLHQVFSNLLSNIFKYVPSRTEVCIEATQSTPSSPVSLCVQDAGPGIPPEELPLLFEKFVRLNRDLAGTTRGTGLGLYICKCLINAMGGRIWVESSGRQGEGSRFCITLPPSAPA